jgi:hypothetical protein
MTAVVNNPVKRRIMLKVLIFPDILILFIHSFTSGKTPASIPHRESRSLNTFPAIKALYFIFEFPGFKYFPFLNFMAAQSVSMFNKRVSKNPASFRGFHRESLSGLLFVLFDFFLG